MNEKERPMVRSRSGTSTTEPTTESEIAELYRLMVARDQAMWDQLTNRDSLLQDRMLELFSRLLDANSIDRVLVTGFTEISEQLKEQMQPLRDLSRPHAVLNPMDDAALASLRRALSRPDFNRPTPAKMQNPGGLTSPADRRSTTL